MERRQAGGGHAGGGLVQRVQRHQGVLLPPPGAAPRLQIGASERRFCWVPPPHPQTGGRRKNLAFLNFRFWDLPPPPPRQRPNPTPPKRHFRSERRSVGFAQNPGPPFVNPLPPPRNRLQIGYLISPPPFSMPPHPQTDGWMENRVGFPGLVGTSDAASGRFLFCFFFREQGEKQANP